MALREHARAAVVLQVEHTHHGPMRNQRDTHDRSDVVRAHVGVVREQLVEARVVDQARALGAPYIRDDAVGRSHVELRAARAHHELGPHDRRLGDHLDLGAVFALTQVEQTATRARRLQRHPQDALQQSVHLDLGADRAHGGEQHAHVERAEAVGVGRREGGHAPRRVQVVLLVQLALAVPVQRDRAEPPPERARPILVEARQVRVLEGRVKLRHALGDHRLHPQVADRLRARRSVRQAAQRPLHTRCRRVRLGVRPLHEREQVRVSVGGRAHLLAHAPQEPPLRPWQRRRAPGEHDAQHRDAKGHEGLAGRRLAVGVEQRQRGQRAVVISHHKCEPARRAAALRDRLTFARARREQLLQAHVKVQPIPDQARVRRLSAGQARDRDGPHAHRVRGLRLLGSKHDRHVVTVPLGHPGDRAPREQVRHVGDGRAVRGVLHVARVHGRRVAGEHLRRALTVGVAVVPDEAVEEQAGLADQVSVPSLLQQVHRQLTKRVALVHQPERRARDHPVERVAIGRQARVAVHE